jgi:2-oxo-3-hexenedioate decarboxylase
MTNGNTNALTEPQAIAAEALAALDTCHKISPFSAPLSAFDLDDAYRVTAAIRQMREMRGEMPVGRKIGFTNRTVWAEYRTIWGYIYNRTVHNLAEIGDTFSLVGLAEPRIEPEIIFKLALAPAPGMDEAALLACIDWVGHGFEIVQSIFPGWKFSAPDAVAPYAEDWSRTLSTFEIDLKRDGTVVDHGRATNVLDGPVSALRHLVDILVRDQVNPPLAAGEIVTTGTLTRALPVSASETWTTELTGVGLDGISVRFA